MKNILQIENLSISFRTDEGTFNMIKDLSYSVGEGEIVGIVGAVSYTHLDVYKRQMVRRSWQRM